MDVKAGAYDSARREVFLLKAVEILRAEGDLVGVKSAAAALDRAMKNHDAAYSENMMQWARVQNPTTESLR
jgi:hypothetical protein